MTFGSCNNVSQRYEKVGRVGEGTYGIVYKARDKETGKFVALKRCIPHHESSDGFPLTTLREIHALKVCGRHENVVTLQQVAVSTTGVFLVFDYYPHDLAKLIDAYYPKHRKSPFGEAHVKTLMRQLLSALEFVHSRFLLHRDIKLSNLLETNNGQLKLADFGLSRHAIDTDLTRHREHQQRLTLNVVSLWYRAPELLLETQNYKYTMAIDLWATGCVMAELLKGYPLLDGRDELEQIDKMVACLGNPPRGLFSNGSSIQLHKDQRHKHHHLSTKDDVLLLDRFCHLSSEGLTLLTKLMDYDPQTRWAATQALASPYFQQNPLPATSMPAFPSKHD